MKQKQVVCQGGRLREAWVPRGPCRGIQRGHPVWSDGLAGRKRGHAHGSAENR